MKSHNSNIILLTFVTFLTRGLPFFLLPLLTIYLSPEDFGLISYIGVFVALGAIFVGFNSHSFLLVKWSTLQASERVSLISLMLRINVFMFLLLIILLFFWFNYFSSINFAFNIIIFIAFISLSRCVFLILDVVLQSTRMIQILAIFLLLQAF